MTGGAGTPTLGSASFAEAAGRNQETTTARGTLPPGSPDFVYVGGRRRTTASYTAYGRAELCHEVAAGPLTGALAAFPNPISLGG